MSAQSMPGIVHRRKQRRQCAAVDAPHEVAETITNNGSVRAIDAWHWVFNKMK